MYPSENSKPLKKLSFKQQMMQIREQAVIDVVYGLLATKGYDAMTVDEVVTEVGIAKASLYRHFPSKEALAVAAMVHAMDKAVDFVDVLIHQNETDNSALALLQEMVRWVMHLKLNDQMPNLPSENSVLRELLSKDEAYLTGFMKISDQLGEWIETAQEEGDLDNSLPAIVILYTLYSRACDPVLGFLKMGGLYTEEEIINLVMKTCFNGIAHNV